MSRYRIVMVAACPFPANHGSPASVREMSEALVRLGHEVHVMAYPYGQDIHVQGVTIHRSINRQSEGKIKVGPSWEKPFLDLIMAVNLCRLIRKADIDIIHAHNYEGALIGFLAKLVTGKPLLYNAVNTMIDELPGYRFFRPEWIAISIARFLDYFIPRAADHITAVSRELAAFLETKGIPADRITIVPAGVNLEMFLGKDPSAVRRRYGIGSRPLVVYTGTLDHFQRIDYLLMSVREIASSLPEMVLMVVSNIVVPAHLEKYRALARELGIEDRVVFLGPVSFEEIPDFLAAANVTVVPRPDCPGHPVKLLNYMAAGKAIVSFEGSAKGVRHLFNGIVVPDHDWKGFGRSIRMVLQDPGLAKTLGENARAGIKGTFDWDTLAAGISVLYEGLADYKKNGTLRFDREKLGQYLKTSYQPVPPRDWKPSEPTGVRPGGREDRF